MSSKIGLALIFDNRDGWITKPINKSSNLNTCDLVIKNVQNMASDFSPAIFITENSSDIDKIQSDIDTVTIKPTAYELLKALSTKFDSYEHVILLWMDCPFFLTTLSRDLLESHISEIADYSYCENFFQGMGVEILSAFSLKKITNIASGNDKSLSRTCIFNYINMDINSYDIETLLSEPDARIYRVSLIADSHVNLSIISRLIEITGHDLFKLTYKELHDIIKEEPQIIRPFPVYFEIEISSTGNESSKINPLCVLNRKGYTMPPLTYRNVLDSIHKINPYAVIGLAGEGDQFLNPDLLEIINITLSFEHFTVIMETYLHNADDKDIKEISSLLNEDFKVIVKINASNKELYKKIHGRDDFESVEKKIISLLNSKKQFVYLEYTRFEDNEDDVNNFYDRWQAFKDNIILMKHNSYAGLLPDRKTLNISPLTRFPCWHLRRSMKIHADGNIVNCLVDADSKIVLGNITKDSIADIWNKQHELYASHFKKDYPGICKDCDEWYSWYF